MKKITAILMMAMMAAALTACGNSGRTENQSVVSSTKMAGERTSESGTTDTESESTEAGTETEAEQNSKTPGADGNILVAYFSVPETDQPDNMNSEEENSTVVIDGEVLGNTQYVAYVIQENTGADIFRIEPETPYPMNHADLEAVATEEKRNNARPKIAAQIENIEQYDTIFLGYPNWYTDLPMILYSFLEEYDLSGKTIVPFVTSGASGFSNTISTITDLQPDATVITDGYSVSRAKVQDTEQEIISWINDLDYSK